MQTPDRLKAELQTGRGEWRTRLRPEGYGAAGPPPLGSYGAASEEEHGRCGRNDGKRRERPRSEGVSIIQSYRHDWGAEFVQGAPVKGTDM